MLKSAAVFALLIRLVTPGADRGEPDRTTRQHVLATAITRAALAYPDPFGVAARLVVLGNHESHYMRRIHAGECKAWECDRQKVKGVWVHAAQGPWQAHRLASLTDEQWAAMVGVEQAPTDLMATYSAKLFMGYEAYCKAGVAGGFAGYATGKKCEWDEAAGLAQQVVAARRFLVRINPTVQADE